MTPTPLPGVLDGIRVLDFSRVLAGPFCAMLLADLGAQVIKVEDPISGDETREWGPPWVGAPQQRLSAYFASVNRNKLSLTLNLKSETGQQIARDLAKTSQIVIENFKPGQMARFGLDYEHLRQHNPTLVYCSISGFGQTGAYAAYPGYDYIIQAMSGLMSITGERDGEPSKVGVAVSDVFTGLFASSAILAALRHAEHTGQGQWIDLALFDAQIAALVNVASNVLVSGQDAPRYGNAHPNIVPYQTFSASDSDFVIAVGNDRQFAALCSLLDRADLPADPRYATNPQRVAHRADLTAELQRHFAARTAAEWVAALHTAGIPAGPINTVQQALHDPQLTTREMLYHTHTADDTPLTLVGSPLHLSATPPRFYRPPPTHGQHTDQLLTELLGYSPDQIHQLKTEHIC